MPHERGHSTATQASNSPIVDGERIYAHFGSRGLFCLDLDGEVLWSKQFGLMFTRNQFGEGTFVWSVGKSKFLSLGYKSWNSGQPDDKPGTTADCVKIGQGGKWSDQGCTELYSYICEYNWPVAK